MDEYQFEQAQLREEQQRAEALACRVQYQGESAHECGDCGSEIPEARRKAVPGCQLCIECQSRQEVRRG